MTALPLGPVLTYCELSQLPNLAGRWLVRAHLRPVPFPEFERFDGVGASVYLITSADRRICWLGQANPFDGVVGRLRSHYESETKRAVFATVRVLQLADLTPPAVLDVIEGRCADKLGLRELMLPRRWPSSEGWPQLVA